MNKNITALSLLLVSASLATAQGPAQPWYDREVTMTPKTFAHGILQTKEDIKKMAFMAMRGELPIPGSSNPELHVNEQDVQQAYNEGYEHGAACLDDAQKAELAEVTEGKKIMLAALIKRFSACAGNGSCKSCEKDVIKYAGALDKEMGLPNPKTLVSDHAPASEEEADAQAESLLAYLYSHIMPIKK